ncbi:MAG: glycosyltransferase family 2 protein [Actinobacteria bacterium]|nr:glycosyltransferase family 2 protein [Actinomycetota bacterium]
MIAEPSIALVLPAYNEERRLGATLDAIAAYARTHGLRLHVIVADDGSTDGTVETALAARAALPLDVLSLPRRTGKGAAVRAGVLAAAADIVGFADADLSTPISELPRLLAPLQGGHDLAIASRALTQSRVVLAQPAYRRAGARVFRELAWLMGGLPGYPDSQCGFKFYWGEVARDLFGAAVIDRWMFDIEILRLAEHRGYRVAQVPVQWRNHPDSRLSLTVDSYRMVRDLLRIRLRFAGGAYGPRGQRVAAHTARVAETSDLT